eukprot:CAMPEP_0119480652 /NCGR_PEP_ID=MMETSP1344-20130328/9364_1 /TAXON_ID=236787 /ORGANISM="Florenciella parvula, Strain CCMP2471" /LENGTH=75 /DNA_ID=CAMNT_0007514983 /DNA_START=87 /DNA_END=314 /DNA_ORIENTATION=-
MKVFAALVALICATQAHSVDTSTERKFLREGAPTGTNSTDLTPSTGNCDVFWKQIVCAGAGCQSLKAGLCQNSKL